MLYAYSNANKLNDLVSIYSLTLMQYFAQNQLADMKNESKTTTCYEVSYALIEPYLLCCTL